MRECPKCNSSNYNTDNICTKCGHDMGSYFKSNVSVPSPKPTTNKPYEASSDVSAAMFTAPITAETSRTAPQKKIYAYAWGNASATAFIVSVVALLLGIFFMFKSDDILEATINSIYASSLFSIASIASILGVGFAILFYLSIMNSKMGK